jgi:hypothetical protein
VEDVMIDSKGFSPVRCTLKPKVGQSMFSAWLERTVELKMRSDTKADFRLFFFIGT